MQSKQRTFFSTFTKCDVLDQHCGLVDSTVSSKQVGPWFEPWLNQGSFCGQSNFSALFLASLKNKKNQQVSMKLSREVN